MNVALKKAYDLERKGLEFYISVAIEIKNALTRRTLFYLAQQEIDHMIKIDDISFSLDKNGKWPEAETQSPASDIEISIREFFEKAGKEVLNQNKENADFIKQAMELEKQSYELYAELAKRSESENEKRFYTELKKQEEEHYEALENVYYYLTDTGNWFSKDEAKVWNWMNL